LRYPTAYRLFPVGLSTLQLEPGRRIRRYLRGRLRLLLSLNSVGPSPYSLRQIHGFDRHVFSKLAGTPGLRKGAAAPPSQDLADSSFGVCPDGPGIFFSRFFRSAYHVYPYFVYCGMILMKCRRRMPSGLVPPLVTAR